MSDKSFEKRFVGFVDLLGFKELVDEIENELPNKGFSFHRINSILNFLHEESNNSDGQHDLLVYENHSDYIIEKELGNPRMNYISDCLIISCDATADGFLALCNKISKFLTDIAVDGLFVRGGISFGNVFHHGPILFGTAYQNAYLAESTRAKVPRVILDEHAVNFLLTLSTGEQHLNTFTLYDKSDGLRYLPQFPVNYYPYRCNDWVNYLLIVKGKLLFHLNRFDSRVNGFSSELRHLDTRYCWKESYGYSLNFDGGHERTFKKYEWLKDEFNTVLQTHSHYVSKKKATSTQSGSFPRIEPIVWKTNHWGVEKDLGRYR